MFTTFGSSQVPLSHFAVTPPSVHSGFYHHLDHRRFCRFFHFLLFHHLSGHDLKEHQQNRKYINTGLLELALS